MPFEHSHGYGTLCSNRTIAPMVYNSARLVGCKLQELFHRNCMFIMNNL